MQDFIAQVFSLAMSPFTSQSFLVWVPCIFSFALGCVMLLFSLMRRR